MTEKFTTEELIKKIVKVLNDKKGIDIVLIDIRGLSSFADYFINVTAGNTRQLETIVDEIHKQLVKIGISPSNVEGKSNSGWILVDLGDIIVNVFGNEEREKYQIEKIWNDGLITEYNREA